MNSETGPPIILVANNPVGHHLLTSQLLNGYRDLDLQRRVILLCNGKMADVEVSRLTPFEIDSFGTPFGGASTFINLLRKLLWLRVSHPRAVYHLRGFVVGAVFFLSRLLSLGRARYIYDPRGAFFIEWQESGRPRLVGDLLRHIEARLIRNSVATIVTSNRFKRLYERLFGYESRYVTIYNTTSFPFSGREGFVPSEGPVRLVYMGTFNYWHDLNELARVMEILARRLGPDRVEINIFTPARFHDSVRNRFRSTQCSKLCVDYVNYGDIPAALQDKHVGVSVVRPTESSRIASPIKIADYVALGLVPLMNEGIGDFDEHFRENASGVLYAFGEEIDLSGLADVRTAPNKGIYDAVSSARARMMLASAVDRLLDE